MRLERLAALAQSSGLPMVAVGEVMMHRAARRPLADVLTCLREGCTIDSIGTRRLTNAERRLKSGAELARLFHRYPAAIRRTLEIADRCAFRLDDLRYQYPDEVQGSAEDGVQGGEPAQARLARLSREGLAWRYPEGPPGRIVTRVDKELALIGEMAYAPYFLTVYDIVAFARSRGILCQGRGSAANSVVCYLLGITEVPPESITLIFERFISRERGEPPDIDVDFEHERREEVIQWIYARYGRHRAGLTATVIHFRSRAAIREVGKVMGLSQDVIARLSGQIWGWSSAPPGEDRLRDAGIDPAASRVALTTRLIGEIIGFPRHLSQHVGGFVITQGRLDELCPIENAAMEDRTVIEWDKDDIDALGLLKVDILALGMLTCIRKAFGLLEDHRGQHLTLANVPPEDSRVYDMLCRADAVGVFQVESRAQLNFLPRMLPRQFYDLVCEVAIVRPGPIQGGMVHPFINRRQGKEPVEDLGPAMMEVLGRTYGVPLFQEQAMQIAVVAAGFSAAEADRLRRSLATFKRMGTIGAFRERFISGMLARGYAADFAQRCFAQIEGFGSYGFPESHAASFARLVYISAWLKCHHPGGLHLRASEQPADGLLCPGTTGARCARARGRGAARFGQSFGMGLHAGAAQRRGAGLAAGVSPDPGAARRGCRLDRGGAGQWLFGCRKPVAPGRGPPRRIGAACRRRWVLGARAQSPRRALGRQGLARARPPAAFRYGWRRCSRARCRAAGDDAGTRGGRGLPVAAAQPARASAGNPAAAAVPKPAGRSAGAGAGPRHCHRPRHHPPAPRHRIRGDLRDARG